LEKEQQANDHETVSDIARNGCDAASQGYPPPESGREAELHGILSGEVQSPAAQQDRCAAPLLPTDRERTRLPIGKQTFAPIDMQCELLVEGYDARPSRIDRTDCCKATFTRRSTPVPARSSIPACELC